mmetsp:Transcript_60661/g.108193  ORF Transcript_60661/g.108193 Transcript_60661/m.108193 type:complete len:97 (-) Transcript_60661:1765-2055(-)
MDAAQSTHPQPSTTTHDHQPWWVGEGCKARGSHWHNTRAGVLSAEYRGPPWSGGLQPVRGEQPAKYSPYYLPLLPSGSSTLPYPCSSGPAQKWREK